MRGGIVIASDSKMIAERVRDGMRPFCACETIAIAESGEKLKEVMKVARPRLLVLESNYWDTATPYEVAGYVERDKRARIAVFAYEKINASRAARYVLAGACAFLDMRSDGCVEGLRRVARGQGYVPAPIQRELERYKLALPEHVALTAREKEVLVLSVMHHSTEEIAGILGIKGGTVRNVMTSVCEKTGLSSWGERVRFAVTEGLVTVEELVGKAEGMAGKGGVDGAEE
jgi:DNA-binding NarL/FixJ family response regulator